VKTSAVIPRYTHLSIPEKIIMLEELWDEIAKTGIEDTPVPQSHKDELSRRHARYLKNPGSVLTVRELHKRIGYTK
jgi:putative addiction module component (TIGR02574 family)